MRLKYPHIRQHDEKDCGAACLSMICEYYGLKLPITRCRELIKVDHLGANIYGMVTGAESIGFNAEALEGNIDELIDGIERTEISFPFIARIVNEQMFEHFIVIYEKKDDCFIVGDPGKLGIDKISIDFFVDQWLGEVITFTPNEFFVPENKRKGSLTKFFKLIINQKKLLAMIFVVSLLISGISIFSASTFEYIVDDAIVIGDVNGELMFDEEEHKHDEHEHDDEHGSSKIESIFEKIENKLHTIFQNIHTVCISVIILYIIRSILQLFRGYALAILTKNIDLPLSLGYYNHLIDLPMNFFGSRKTGELMSRFSDASNIRDAVSTATLTIMLDTLMAIFTGIYLFIINYKLFLITVIVLIIYAIIMMSFRKPIRVINQNIMEGNAQITSYLKESIEGIETVKAYGYEKKAKEKTRDLFLRFVNQIVHGTIVYNIQDVLVSIVESIGLVVLLWAGAYLCIENIITVGILIAYYYLLDYFLDPMKNLIELQPTMQTAIVAAERLNDILDVEEEDQSKREIPNMYGDIIFSNVSFRYGNRNLVLENINLKIKKGAKIALVGESGSGKTTLVKLLMNFYAPENGTIAIGGRNLSKYTAESVREHTAYISQDIFLFSDTIYNNLRMSDDNISDGEIEEMCRMCFADQFIRELPFGYDTMLEENGNNLSGGQKQRLAIVRALLKKPDILIMDEATSNLDVITEQSIQKIIDGLSKKMTIIVIAHRLKTIRSCDVIYVMENGKIVEQGNHNALIGANGLYSRYWKSQE